MGGGGVVLEVGGSWWGRVLKPVVEEGRGAACDGVHLDGAVRRVQVLLESGFEQRLDTPRCLPRKWPD